MKIERQTIVILLKNLELSEFWEADGTSDWYLYAYNPQLEYVLNMFGRKLRAHPNPDVCRQISKEDYALKFLIKKLYSI